MNATEVYETPDPEVTFQPYAAVQTSQQHAIKSQTSASDSLLYDKNDLELNEETVPPVQAFEVFMGKVYKPSSLLSNQTEFELIGAKTQGKKPQTSELESPLARFSRLSVEIKELEQDLTALVAASSSTQNGASNPDPRHKILFDAAQEAEFDEIMRGLATLQINLQAMRQRKEFEPFLADASLMVAHERQQNQQLQKELTSRFFKQLEAIRQHTASSNEPTPMDISSSSTSSSGNSQQPAMIYEIYSNGELNAVEKDAKTRIVALESRLFALERAVGKFESDGSVLDVAHARPGSDLSSTITKLEKRIELMNIKSLDAIKSRTAALVHELTLLNKLKETPAAQAVLEQEKHKARIDAIYKKLMLVEETAAAVPQLVERLTTLKSVHDDNIRFNERLKKMETSNEQILSLLDSDRELLQNVESSLEANMKIFHNNINALDARMQSLLQS